MQFTTHSSLLTPHSSLSYQVRQLKEHSRPRLHKPSLFHHRRLKPPPLIIKPHIEKRRRRDLITHQHARVRVGELLHERVCGESGPLIRKLSEDAESELGGVLVGRRQ